MKNTNTSLVDIKVLAVDDMDNILQIVRSTLKKVGCTDVLTAHNGKQAMEILDNLTKSPLKTARVNLIISDWNMPVANGLELLKWVREHEDIGDTLFIMLTAEQTKEQVLAAVHLRVDNYIIKPFTPSVLIEKIIETLNKKKRVSS